MDLYCYVDVVFSGEDVINQGQSENAPVCVIGGGSSTA